MTVLLICATVLCLSAIIGSLLNDDPSVFGFRAFYVLSGSMEPTIHESALVLVKRSSVYEIGDVITFTSKNPEISGAPNTHRIVEIIQNGKKTEYITKGDANPTPDEEHVLDSEIIGRVVFHTGAVEWLGSFLEFLMTTKGFMLIVVIPIVAIVISCLRDYVKAYKEALQKVREEYEKQLAGQSANAEKNTDNFKNEKIPATTENTEAAVTEMQYNNKNTVGKPKSDTQETDAPQSEGMTGNKKADGREAGSSDGKESNHEGH